MGEFETSFNLLMDQIDWYQNRLNDLEQRLDDLEAQNIETVRLTSELVRILRGDDDEK